MNCEGSSGIDCRWNRAGRDGYNAGELWLWVNPSSIYTRTHTHTHIYIYTYTCIYIYIHTHIYIYIYMYMYMYIYIYIYIYICVYMYKRAIPRLARPRLHCGFGGLSATNGRRHRRFGRSQRPRVGRGDEDSLGRLGPRGRREKPLGGARGRIGAMAGVLS